MMPVALYTIHCPNGHATELPETVVEEIILHLRESGAAVPDLNLVCSTCKTAFHFDYSNALPAGWTVEPRRMAEFHVLFVRTGCDEVLCRDTVDLIAVRNGSSTTELVLEEQKSWIVSGVKCQSGHSTLPPVSKQSPVLNFARAL